jgi:Lon protease-like protein
VFFYNQTMLPGNKLSLHLFEPRYKLMMSRIVNTNRAFAYISSHYRADVSDVALIAELEEAEFLADGRCLLEATLKRRSRVVEHYVEDGTQGLHFCRLEPFADEEVPAAAQEGLQQLRQRATALAEQLLSDAHTRRVVEQQFGSMPADVELFSMWFASISPLNDSEKTQALHSRSTVDRLSLSVQRTENYLERRRNGRSFPIASAVSSTIATALTALMGGTAPDYAGSAATSSTGTAQGASGRDQDSVPDLIGSSSDSDMQDDEEEGEEESSGYMSEDGESRPSPQQGLAWAAQQSVAGGEEEGGEEE